MGRSSAKRSALRRLDPPQRPRPYASSLDRAAGFELDWEWVPPVCDAARHLPEPCFVYFIGERDGGYLKIGTAKDPVGRLRELQTGNPRSLSIEYVLLGDRELESLLHSLWQEYGVLSMRSRDTEWFRPSIREPLTPILALAIEQQITAMEQGNTALPELQNIVRLAHLVHGI